MSSKTTVAIDKKLRKKLKKIALFLDLTQNEVIERALSLLEQNIVSKIKEFSSKNPSDTSKETIKNTLDIISQKVCEMDKNHKKIQDILYSGPESIDDIITTSWITGLDLE